MSRRLRWDLLSTARINRVLIPLLHASARNELAAVASRALARAAAYAKEWNIPRAYGRRKTLVKPARKGSRLHPVLGRAFFIFYIYISPHKATSALNLSGVVGNFTPGASPDSVVNKRL
jgi:hypothetical protein